jgi:Lipase maturation factor
VPRRGRVFPRWISSSPPRSGAAPASSTRAEVLERFSTLRSSRAQTRAAAALGIVVAVLSVAPVINLASCSQSMNRSFDPLDLVNTYGAFGGVDRERYEVILEGTRDGAPVRSARWEEYELPCMPGDPHRRPCIVAPYQHRLDWQMWFVGNGARRGESLDEQPWLVHLVWQLLSGAPEVDRLFSRDPFAGEPPRWVRADIWRYAFTSDRAEAGGAWWTRERVGVFLRPVSMEDPALREYVRSFDWPDAPP